MHPGRLSMSQIQQLDPQSKQELVLSAATTAGALAPFASRAITSRPTSWSVLGVCAPETSARPDPQHVGIQKSECYCIWYRDRRQSGQNRSATQAPSHTVVLPHRVSGWGVGARMRPIS